MTQIRKEYQNNTTHNKVYSPYPAGYAPYTNRCVPFEKIDEMNNINFNNKKFILLENSKSGTVNSNTIFTYEQSGNLVTANYQGGVIKYGKIIAHKKKDELFMLYQCISIENELKAGKAIAKISLTKNNKIKLKLNWKWLTDDFSTGTSEYIEL